MEETTLNAPNNANKRRTYMQRQPQQPTNAWPYQLHAKVGQLQRRAQINPGCRAAGHERVDGRHGAHARGHYQSRRNSNRAECARWESEAERTSQSSDTVLNW